MKFTEIIKKIKPNRETVPTRSDYYGFKNQARDAIVAICQKQSNCDGCYFAIKSDCYIFCSLNIAQEQVSRDGCPSSPVCWEK